MSLLWRADVLTQHLLPTMSRWRNACIVLIDTKLLDKNAYLLEGSGQTVFLDNQMVYFSQPMTIYLLLVGLALLVLCICVVGSVIVGKCFYRRVSFERIFLKFSATLEKIIESGKKQTRTKSKQRTEQANCVRMWKRQRFFAQVWLFKKYLNRAFFV